VTIGSLYYTRGACPKLQPGASCNPSGICV
jgi:hypothetical protein